MKNIPALSCSLLIAVSAVTSEAAPFDQMVVFGASYMDSGQLPDLDIFGSAGLDGTTGLRFTNVDPDTGLRGKSLVEHLATDLGLGALPASTPVSTVPRTDGVESSNINFAYGGARAQTILDSITGDSVISHPIFPDVVAPGFTARVASGDVSFSEHTLFVINIGGNDMRDAADPVAISTIGLTAVQALADAGARTILVPSLPRLGEFSESSNLAGSGRSALSIQRTQGAEQYNALMDEGLRSINANIIRPDVSTLFDEMLGDPAAFGFSASIDHSRQCYDDGNATLTGIVCTEPAGLGQNSGGSPDQFIFNDGLHPTQAAAIISADYLESLIRAPGQLALLPEVGLSSLTEYQGTLAAQAQATRWVRAPEKITGFVSVSISEQTFDETRNSSEADSDTHNITLGVNYQLDNHWRLGVALGRSNHDVDLSRNSEVELQSTLLSVMSSYQQSNWFVEAQFTVGRVDLDGIKRVITLGDTLRRVERGNTGADVSSVAVQLGVDLLSSPQWRLGPVVGLNAGKIDIDGYREKSMMSTSLTVDDLERDSLLGSLGLFFNSTPELADSPWRLFGELVYEKEFEDESDNVRVSLNTLSSAPGFSMPGGIIDESAVRLSLGAEYQLDKLSAIDLSYRFRDADVESEGVTLSFRRAF